MKNIELVTTDEEFNDGHLLINKGRSKTIAVRRTLLVNLLMDHSNMIKRLESLGDSVSNQETGRIPNVWGAVVADD